VCPLSPTALGYLYAPWEPLSKTRPTIDPAVHEKVIAEAARVGVSLSAWMTKSRSRGPSETRRLGRHSGMGAAERSLHQRRDRTSPPQCALSNEVAS
jgi:hypothetical protein